MKVQTCFAIVVCLGLCSTPTVEAVTVARKRVVTEEITVDDLFGSLVRGLGFKLAQKLVETDVQGLRTAAETLDIELESMEFTLSERSEEKARVALRLPELTIDVLSIEPDFQVKKIDNISQASEFWATVQGRRIHFRQELAYLPGDEFVRLDLRVLNSVGRVNRLDFYFDLYEEDANERTRIETGLTVGACVPGLNGGLIHRIAARQISARSDRALVELDRKVREIIATDDSNFLELVPLLARRAIEGVR